MNTLDDLRATLDSGAATVHDHSTTARVAAVRGRARAVRRRRAAGGALAVALAVGGVSAVALLPGGERQLPPVDRSSGWDTAPTTIDAAGWRYRFAWLVGTEEARHVSDGLEASDRPRLVTWTTSGDDQDVTARLAAGDRWVSDADDFADHLWVPPGYEGEVRVEADEPGVALAVYEVDESVVPPGVSRDGVTFREHVGGHSLVDAVVGERGEADLAFDFTVPERPLSVTFTCAGLPAGHVVHVSLDGTRESVVAGRCDTSFDPGASLNHSFDDGIGVPPGGLSTARIWATTGMRGDRVAAGELPDLQLGLGLYALDDDQRVVAGLPLPELLESRGRLWQLRTVQEAGGQAPRLSRSFPRDGEPWLVTVVQDATGTTTTEVRVDGEVVETVVLGTGGPAAVPELLVPRGTTSLQSRVVRGRESLRHHGWALYAPVG